MVLDSDFIKQYEKIASKDIELALKFCFDEFNQKKDPDILIYIGESYMVDEKFDLAVNYINKAIESNCKNRLLAYSLIGESLFYLGLYEKSKEYFLKVLDLDKESFFATIYLIDINLSEKNYKLAKKIGEDFLEYSNLNSEDKSFLIAKIAWIQLRYTKEYTESINNVKEALSINKNCGNAYIVLGFYNLSLERYKEAMRSFKNAIKLGEECEEVYYGIKECTMKMGIEK